MPNLSSSSPLSDSASSSCSSSPSSFHLVENAAEWKRVNSAEDNAGDAKISEKCVSRAESIVSLLNNIDAFSSSAQDDKQRAIVEQFRPVQALLHKMVASNADAITGGAAVEFNPYVFITRLRIAVVTRIQQLNAKHEPLDETLFGGDIPAEPLDFMFKLIRRIDRDPQRFVFGFIYSLSDDTIVPVCAQWCGMKQEKELSDAIDEQADRIQIDAIDASHGAGVAFPDSSSSSHDNPAVKPDEKQQKRDAVIILSVLQGRVAIAKQLAALLKQGKRVRLLITMHGNGASYRIEPLDAELRAHLSVNANQHDKTLEWLSTFETSTAMVVTLQDNHGLSTGRTYVMLQPWIRDPTFFAHVEAHAAAKEKEKAGVEAGKKEDKEADCTGASENECKRTCACKHH